eukprot:7579873-Pyramimonas_sp.AAC.1
MAAAPKDAANSRPNQPLVRLQPSWTDPQTFAGLAKTPIPSTLTPIPSTPTPIPSTPSPRRTS